MKINKIYISAFGKLKDYTLELNDGLNVIFGENENGKSTVMAFIKMMFYGSGKKAQKLSASPRQKYTPWSGDTMGGRIYFEHNSRRYCLEREFKKSDAYDRITLTDTDLNTTLPASSDIGVRFFGLSASAFERSLYIGSFCGVSGDETASGELNAKLSNLALTGDEDTSYQSVSERIETAKYALVSKSGKKGKFAEYSAKLEELTSRLAAADSDARRRQQLDIKLQELQREYEKTKSQYLEAKSIIDSENDIRNTSKLKEYLELKDKLDALNDTLKLSDGKISDEMFVKKVDFCLNKLETQRTRAAELQEQTEKIKSAIELSSEKNIAESKAQLEESNRKILGLKTQSDALTQESQSETDRLNQAKEKQKLALSCKKTFNPPLFIIGIILAVLSVLFMVISPFILSSKQTLILYFTAAVLIAGIVLTVLSFIFRPLNKALILKAESEVADITARIAQIRNEQADLQEQINALTSQVSLLTAALNTDAAMRAQRISELEEKLDALSAEREKEAAALSDLLSVFGRYSDITDPEKIREALVILSQKADEQKQLKLRLSYLSSDLGGISYELAREKLESLKDAAGHESTTDFEAVKSKAEELNHRLSELVSQISAITTELKTGFKNTDSPQSLKSEISALKASLLRQKQFLDAAGLAAEVLSESFAEVRRGYGSVLEKKTLDIFSRLTAGRYNSLNISDLLDITVEQTGVFGTRELEYLSNGTMDQAYLSLRLAASELISEEDSLPIIMDDSLSQYDDRRTDEAVDFLCEYSQKSQTILFTCHSSVCRAAENHGIEIKNL